jgi:hypothetical protein
MSILFLYRVTDFLSPHKETEIVIDVDRGYE